MAKANPLEGKLVVLLGGAGFFGGYIASELLERGARLRIAARHPEKAFSLKPQANLGQLQFARCDVTDPRSVEQVMKGADAAVYLVGAFSGDQQALQADGAGYAARAAAKEGSGAFVYVSAIGADAEDEESAYARTKGDGELQVLEAFPKATILRPSILFGENDNFLNMFAGLISTMPALPVFGADSPLQPVWVDDAAQAACNALADPASHGGKTYELGGPETITMEELHKRIASAQHRDRSFIKVPDAISSLFAAVPLTPMNSDQWTLLKRGSTASGEMPGIDKLGVTPKPLSLFLDRWMTRFRKHGRFGDTRAA